MPGEIPAELLAPYKDELGIYIIESYHFLYSRLFFEVSDLPVATEDSKVYMYRIMINDTYISDAGLI